jgi:hypothetical protein
LRQGFVGLDSRTLHQINCWLRLSPAICMTWAAVGTALGSARILWALVPFAVLGAVLPGHPFDVLYTYGFRYVVHGPAAASLSASSSLRVLDRKHNPRRSSMGISDG